MKLFKTPKLIANMNFSLELLILLSLKADNTSDNVSIEFLFGSKLSVASLWILNWLAKSG